MGKPLVSVVMPTWNRPRFAERALELILAQTYDNLEILVLDDSDPWQLMRLPREAEVRYYRLPSRFTIGEKWHVADEVARGEIVVHWDDDDYYSPRRIVRQIEPLVLDQADLVGLGMDLVLTIPDCRFWRFKREPSRIRGHSLHDGTIAYRRGALKALYRDSSLGESTAFVNEAISGGARIVELHQKDLFVYVRHDRNSWRFDARERLEPAPQPRWFPEEMLVFYKMAAADVP